MEKSHISKSIKIGWSSNRRIKKIQISSKPAKPVIEIKKRFPQPRWNSQLQTLRDKRKCFYKIFRKINCEQHLIQWKKKQSRIQESSRKKRWKTGKFLLALSTALHLQFKPNRVTQLRGKYPKNVNILEDNGTQYKDTKILANKIGESLIKLLFPHNYDPNFLELEQKEEQKTIKVNHTNKEIYNKPFSNEELIQAIEATKNSASCPDQGPHHTNVRTRLSKGL